MRKIFVILVLLSWIFALSAQNSGTGLGLILGEPTGVCGKMWIGSNTAYDAAAAWSFGDEAALHLHADMLFHNFKLIESNLPVYYGIGVRVKLADDPKLGVRMPVGIDYFIPNAPLDVFFEIVPILNLMPETEFGINSGLGLRYFF